MFSLRLTQTESLSMYEINTCMQCSYYTTFWEKIISNKFPSMETKLEKKKENSNTIILIRFNHCRII